MPYKITIEETKPVVVDDHAPVDQTTKIFEQTVPSLNLKAVINTINAAPRKPRAPKAK